MAGAAIGSARAVLPHRCSSSSSRSCLLLVPAMRRRLLSESATTKQPKSKARTRKPLLSFADTSNIRAFSSASMAAATVEPNTDPSLEAEPETKSNKLACPICYFPLVTKQDQTLESTSGPTLECNICKKIYLNKGEYFDLTLTGGSAEYRETKPAATELFRSPLVSFLYERGWRQNFIWGGFPGPEKEFETAKDYLKPTIGGTIIDASCGSGLFSRMFVKSGMYSLVVGLDFSENMLHQCNEFVKQENIPAENLILVRADISRLPVTSSSIDAVHAGAALHCWPSPASAVAEVSRVLRPGGVFVASTFILDVLPPTVPVLRILRQNFSQISGNNIFLSEGELKDLCKACGLVNFTCVRNGPYIMLSAIKAG